MIELNAVAGPLSMQFAGTVHARKSDFGNLFFCYQRPDAKTNTSEYIFFLFSIVRA